MTETEVAVKLENHDQHIKSLERRMSEAEERGKVLQDLALSVQKLAMGIEQLNLKSDDMSTRLQEIEDRPGQNWNTMTRTIFTAIVSTIAGGLAVWIAQGLSMVH